MTPSGTRRAERPLSIYFANTRLANAFVARWCAGATIETAGGVVHIRQDEPQPRVGAGMHRTP